MHPSVKPYNAHRDERILRLVPESCAVGSEFKPWCRTLLLYFPFPQSGSRQRTMDAFSRPTASTHLFLPPPLPFFLLSLFPPSPIFSLSLFLFSPQTFLSLYRVLCPISSSLHKYISAWQTPPLNLTTRVLVAFVLRPYTSWTDFLFVASGEIYSFTCL